MEKIQLLYLILEERFDVDCTGATDDARFHNLLWLAQF